jgi:hypothetical protein
MLTKYLSKINEKMLNGKTKIKGAGWS